MFQGLRTVVYAVDDLEKAKDWYSRLLNQSPYFDEPFYVGYNVGGYELGLIPNESANDADKATGVTTYWGVEDADVTYAKLLVLGATPHEAVQDVGGGIRAGAVKDPFGNVVGIIYNPHSALPDAG